MSKINLMKLKEQELQIYSQKFLKQREFNTNNPYGNIKHNGAP
jgi:hypothetical protein